MKVAELREKSRTQLHRRLEASQKELIQLKFSAAGKELKDVSQLKKKRKEIAKILTVLREIQVLDEMKKEEGKNA